MRLVLCRHGDAAPVSPDHERPLTRFGVQSVEASAEQLAVLGLVETQIWSSSALRASQTAKHLARRLGIGPVQELEDLYLASPSGILSLIRTAEPRDLVVVGHNPGLSELASSLARRPTALRPADYSVVEVSEWGALR